MQITHFSRRCANAPLNAPLKMVAHRANPSLHICA